MNRHQPDTPSFGDVVPHSFREQPRWWSSGADWLDAIPRILSDQCKRWQLRPDGAALHGSNALVLPVTRDDVPLALRVTPPHDGFGREVEALRFWDGRGTVQLIDADVPAGAMLLERLDTTGSLADVPLWDAAPIAARLMTRLAVPVGPDVSSTGELVFERRRSLWSEWVRLGAPFAPGTVEAAVECAIPLEVPVGRLAVNGDLHYGQILAGAREPWLVVDPVLLRGDREYDLARLLWSRLDEMGTDGEVRSCFDTIVREAAVDERRARDWVLFRSVDYWLWGLANGLTEDPERCRRLVSIFQADRADQE